MSDDIKERLVDFTLHISSEMRQAAHARIEALEAQLTQTQAHLAMRNSDIDECKAQLAAAREALEKVTGSREFDPSDLESVAPDQTPEEYVCEQALLVLGKDTQ